MFSLVFSHRFASFARIAFLTFITAMFLTACGGGGGGSSTTTSTPTQSNNPSPTVTSVTPLSAVAGATAVTVTVNGTGFISGSTVQWNQSNRTTTFVSATQVQAAITAADLATAGTAQVTVVNPTPGGGTSGPTSFTINNPAPAIASLSQSSVTAGSAALSVGITGTGFVQNSTVQWNQSNRPTTFVSSTQLQVALTAADLASGGTGQLTVVNSGPGGGTSSALAFTINNPAPQVSAISPTTVTTVDGGSLLTVTGSGFVSTSVITWNGVNRTTSYVSSTQLQTALLAADVATVGSAQISVSTPTPGGGAASAAQLTIQYPVPVINTLNPAGVVAGSAAFTLSVNGAGFSPSSTVQFNGTNRPTLYVNSTLLRIGVTASDIANPGNAQITVVTGAPGGGTSKAATLAIGTYPVPAITNVNPTSIVVNSPDTTAFVQGSGFISLSTVQVNGSDVTVNGVSSNFLSFKIPSADLTSVGTLSITVSNPGPSTSNAVTINVTPIPVPTLNSLSPNSVAVGSAGFTLSLFGSNFVSGSVVQWNGSPRTTTFVNSGQLTINISAGDIQSLGNNLVTVVNPTPGGGPSSALGLTTYLPLPTHDLVYDSSRKLLWASVPSVAGPTLGNAVVSIDPYTGVLGTPIWVGSEPNKLAISDDGSTLWVTFLGTPSARKIDLNSQTATAVAPYFPGGWGGNFYATDLAVMPGSPSTVAIVTGAVSIYDDATARSKISTNGSSYVAFGANAGTLYGFSGGLSIYSVDSTGIASTTTPANSGTFSNDLRYDNGRLYLTSGGILDGTSGSLLGTFAASGPVAPDSVVGRAFILNSGPQFGSANQITAFDMNTFVPVGSFPVSAVQSGFNTPGSLVRWGQDGLAFRSDTQVFIVRNALVRDLSATPADVSASLSSPASSTTGANTSTTITITNNGPNAASNVTMLNSSSANAIFVSATPSQGSCSGGSTLRCNLGNLSNGATATVTLVVIPSTGTTLTNTATVAATQADPNESNNTANSSTSITGSDYNPAPAVSSLTPQSALVGAAALTLTVNGSNFTGSSTVNWNGAALPTTFVNSTQLTATVDGTLLAAAGSADVTVNNASPGGGSSQSLPFPIFQTVALDTNDIVFDPFTRKLYASVPSTASQVTGNSIVSIDPATGALGTPVFIGSEPTRMSLSDNGQFLYVVLSGSKSVRRMDLPTVTPGTQFTAISALFGAFTPSDLAVMPGNQNVVATVGYSDGIQVWDVTSSGATARPLTKSLVNNVYEGSVLAWADSANLYSNDEGLSPSSFHRFSVGSTSFAETDSTSLDALGGKITYSGGLVFSDGGGVVDPSPAPPATPHLVGKFLSPGGGSSAVDTTSNRVFFLNQNTSGVNSRTITGFDASRFTFVGSTQLDGLTGDAFDLIRWGADGLAFRTAKDFWGSGSGRVVLVNGPFVLPRSATSNPVPSISLASPNAVTSPAPNTWVTVTGTQFVAGSVVLWNGSARSTVFVNSGQLKVAIPAADLAAPQTVNLQVVNPTPGGGTSGTLAFAVN